MPAAVRRAARSAAAAPTRPARRRSAASRRPLDLGAPGSRSRTSGSMITRRGAGEHLHQRLARAWPSSLVRASARRRRTCRTGVPSLTGAPAPRRSCGSGGSGPRAASSPPGSRVRSGITAGQLAVEDRLAQRWSPARRVAPSLNRTAGPTDSTTSRCLGGPVQPAEEGHGSGPATSARCASRSATCSSDVGARACHEAPVGGARPILRPADRPGSSGGGVGRGPGRAATRARTAADGPRPGPRTAAGTTGGSAPAPLRRRGEGEQVPALAAVGVGLVEDRVQVLGRRGHVGQETRNVTRSSDSSPCSTAASSWSSCSVV